MTTFDPTTIPQNDDCLFCQDHLEEAALGILEADDRVRVEHHLAGCPICRAELAELEQNLPALAFVLPDDAPRPQVKDQLLARMTAEQDRVATKAAVPTSAPVRTRKPARRSPLPWSYGAVFAGLAVALLAIGIWSLLPFERPGSDLPRGQIQVMAMELTCDDCDADVGGQLGADPSEPEALVVAWNLDPDHSHEVWCVTTDGRPTKVEDLHVADTGSVMQTVQFPDDVGDCEEIYVARDDGALELSVVPAEATESDDSDPAIATPTE